MDSDRELALLKPLAPVNNEQPISLKPTVASPLKSARPEQCMVYGLTAGPTQSICNSLWEFQQYICLQYISARQ